MIPVRGAEMLDTIATLLLGFGALGGAAFLSMRSGKVALLVALGAVTFIGSNVLVWVLAHARVPGIGWNALDFLVLTSDCAGHVALFGGLALAMRMIGTARSS